jgi:hypothetical protein
VKLLVIISLNLVLLCLRAEAANYTVKAGGGGNYTTIQACATAMAASDTCTVYAGTYNEVVTIPPGTAGNIKTVDVNPGDVVHVYGFVVNSYTAVDGFQIQNPSSPSSAACIAIKGNAVYWQVLKNAMYACGDGSAMISEPLSYATTGYGTISGNTLSYGCSTSGAPNVCEGMRINGDHHLIQDNDISHVSDGHTNYGSYNVYRNNTMHDTNVSDCGSHSSNCHIDFIESEPNISGGVTVPAQYNLYEGNTVLRNEGGNNHVFLTQGDACSGNCFNLIIRFNLGAHIGSTAGSGYVLLDQLGGYRRVKDYNNTYAAVGTGGDVSSYTASSSTYGAEINTIFYYPQSIITTPYAVDSTSTGFTAGSNLAHCTGTCTLYARNQSGTFTSDAPGNLSADPNFVNASADNYALASGSPAIQAGTNLTTAVGSGSSSTSLTVADAGFFQDGLGDKAFGVQADWIRIGASTTVQVSAVNYSTNVLTLNTPVNWSSGAGIYLYKNSSGTVVLNNARPDIGAFQYGQQVGGNNPSPPTSLRATVQ